MTRETAYQIVTKYLTNPKLLTHSLATEAVMRSLAIRCGADIEEWGITGLLHDADYDRTKGHPELHTLELFKLEPNSIPTNIQHAIQAHNNDFTNIKPISILDWALLCCDELTLITQQLSLKQKDKTLMSLTSDSILEKLKQKNFDKEVNKENIFLSETKLGIPLAEFVGIVLKAMQGIHQQLETTPQIPTPVVPPQPTT